MSDGLAWPMLKAGDFPAGTPLNAFFAWNEDRRRPDRRYTLACDLHWLYRRFETKRAGTAACLVHLAVRPLIRRRARRRVLLEPTATAGLAALSEAPCGPSAAAAERVVAALTASIGSGDAARHAALFAAFEDLAAVVDLAALAARRPRRRARAEPARRRRILVIKLSALGDFVQALGPAAAIRRHHRMDEITLLTTPAFADLARQSGLFDRILFDPRPKPHDVAGWLALRREVRKARFDRVYDLQTSDRSSFYSWLFLPGRRPEWSGIAWRCSHPHANLARDPQHTLAKQAEQLLMAGVYPTPLPSCPPSGRPLPRGLEPNAFFLVIPGSSPRHPEKRWPAPCYGALAQRLRTATGLRPVIVGASDEASLAAEIRSLCPEAIDLAGRTTLTRLVDLAEAAAFSIGNDTGATHVAAAAGKPVVVLFSAASDPSRCAPRGPEVRVLAASILDRISVDRVLAEISEIYGPTASPVAPVAHDGR